MENLSLYKEHEIKCNYNWVKLWEDYCDRFSHSLLVVLFSCKIVAPVPLIMEKIWGDILF